MCQPYIESATALSDKYSVHIYLLCMIKVRVKWCTCSLWRML